LTIDLDGKDTSITGSINNNGGGSTNLGLSDGATWYNTGDSSVSVITGNTGFIYFDDAEVTLEIGKNDNADLKIIYPGEVNDVLGDDGEDVINDNIEIKAGNNATVILGEGEEQDGYSFDLGPGGIIDGSQKSTGNSNAANAYSGAILNYLQLQVDQNNLTKRLGELRDSDGNNGIWARAYRGKRGYDNSGVAVANTSNTYQLGYDKNVSGSFFVGAALSYTQASGNVSDNLVKGNSENKNTGFAVYGTKLNDNGSYIDLIARYGKQNNKVTSYSTLGAANNAEYDSTSYSVSAELGKRIMLRATGYYFEPQLELSYGHIGEVEYVSGGAVNIKQNAINSLTVRAGFTLGKNIEEGNVYIRLHAVHEFSGKADINIGARTEKLDFSGTGYEIGIGANFRLKKNAHLYVDVEKSFSSAVKTTWQWNAGVRFEF
jgi:outer membrane autotransporter protein